MRLDLPETPIPQRLPREMALPKRTGACDETWDLAKDPRAKEDCAETAPGVLARGFREHVACHPTQIIIDGCAPLEHDELPLIMTKLGWAGATPEQREAIAWLVVRAALMDRPLEKASDEFTSPEMFAPPVAKRVDKGLVLTYWVRPPLQHTFVERTLTFGDESSFADENSRTVEEKDDPQLRRKQALEAARDGGAL